ncbi:hypothetical protein ACI3K4_02850 [Streptomyces sp. CSMPJR101]|uniref:hypothetical protein n=1 Tax=Streptomyces sp. CSMPJR101 TaxID=1279378 RepID=UPI0038531797
MALLAVLLPILMLCVMLALGRYEELLLPKDPEPLPSKAPGLVTERAATPGDRHPV